MSVKVGRVVEHAAKALGTPIAKFLENIEASVTPPNSRSEFSKTMTRDYKPGSIIRCSWQFASAVLDYLDEHRDDIADERSRLSAYDDCMSVLTDTVHRNKRYGFFATDILPASERASQFAGSYALVRQETGERGLIRQELLVLDHAGTAERPGRALGTLITPEIITRGIWAASDKTLTYMGWGRRQNYSIGFVAMEFVWPDDRRDLLAGILFGTSSIEGTPVVLPLLAVKLPEGVSRHAWQALCDRSDAELRREFEGCGRYKKQPADLREILDGFAIAKDTRVMTAAAMIAPLRALGKEPRSFILPGVREFAERNVVEPPEPPAP
ncbi:MAG: hypothetical protein WDO17_15575 [Alphaproteobacteria bacterium]